MKINVTIQALADFRAVTVALPMDDGELLNALDVITWEGMRDAEVVETELPGVEMYNIIRVNDLLNDIDPDYDVSKTVAVLKVIANDYDMEEAINRVENGSYTITPVDSKELTYYGHELADRFNLFEGMDADHRRTFELYFDYEQYANDYITNNSVIYSEDLAAWVELLY